MTVLALAVDGDERLIRCRGVLPDGSECRQLLARRWAAGGLEVVVKGDTYGPDGRVVIVCPACQRRIRVNPRKAA